VGLLCGQAAWCGSLELGGVVLLGVGAGLLGFLVAWVLRGGA